MSEAVASNAPDRLRRWWHWLGIAWLVLLLVMGAQQWRLWSQQSRIDTDILAVDGGNSALDRHLAVAARDIRDRESLGGHIISRVGAGPVTAAVYFMTSISSSTTSRVRPSSTA